MSAWSLPMLNRTPLQSASTLINLRWLSLRNRLRFGRTCSSGTPSLHVYDLDGHAHCTHRRCIHGIPPSDGILLV